MGNIYLVESEDFDQNPMYSIGRGDAWDRKSTHCVIQLAKISKIKTHSLITAHHPLGGGSGGWDSYDENLAIVEGLSVSKEQLFDHAHKYAKELSARIGYTYFDLDKVKEIQGAEGKLNEAKDNLETLTS